MRTLKTLLTATLAFSLTTAAVAQGADHTADLAELTSYTLTADKLTSLIAANAEIDAAAASDADLKKAADGMAITSESGFDARTTAAASSPKIVAIAETHGFTPHELVVASMEWFMAGTAVAMIQSGQPREDILSHPGVNKASAELMEKSPDAMAALQKKLAATPVQ